MAARSYRKSFSIRWVDPVKLVGDHRRRWPPTVEHDALATLVHQAIPKTCLAGHPTGPRRARIIPQLPKLGHAFGAAGLTRRVRTGQEDQLRHAFVADLRAGDCNVSDDEPVDRRRVGVRADREGCFGRRYRSGRGTCRGSCSCPKTSGTGVPAESTHARTGHGLRSPRHHNRRGCQQTVGDVDDPRLRNGSSSKISTQTSSMSNRLTYV